VDQSTNDNDVPEGRSTVNAPNPHGSAALLLVESLIHSMIDRSLISVEEAVEIVQVAAEVKQGTGLELGDDEATIRKSVGLLDAIKRSLLTERPEIFE
jgi:hypothetical protein